MERQNAIELLKKYNKEPFHILHGLTVEGVMRWYAKEKGEDESYWGLVGLFEFDLVAWAFGGTTAIISRIIYTVIALAGVWCISLLFRDRAVSRD